MSHNPDIVDVLEKSPSDKLEPLIVNFQNGTLKGESLSNIDVGVFVDSQKSSDRIVICETEGLCYLGSTRSNDIQNYQKSFIALHNKKTNKVKLIEVNKATLSPVINTPASTNPMLIEDEKNGSEKDKSQSEIIKDFVHKFGMLRGQRLYDQAERLTVKADIIRAHLEDAAMKVTVEENQITPGENNSFSYLLPPQNREASSVSDIYNMEDIVTNEDVKSLSSAAGYCLKAEQSEIDSWRSSNQYSPMFITQLIQLRQSKNQEEDKLKSLIPLIYMEGLVKLANLKGFAVRKKNPLPDDFPSDVARRITDRFMPVAQGQQRVFTKVNRERVICHIIILALLSGDFCVDLQLLSSSLHLNVDKLVPLVKVVGAQVITDKSIGQNVAILKLPLPPPMKPSFRRKKL